MAWEGLRRIVRQRPHPAAKLGRMHPQVLRGLRITNPALLDQPNSLKLELTGKLPSLHDAPPAPSKHLTRCLRNRVQAIPILFDFEKPRADSDGRMACVREIIR